MKRLTLLLLLVIMVGCSTTKKEYKEVYIDRPIYCAELPKEKEYATSRVNRESSTYAKIEALVIEREERIVTEEELRAIIKGCSMNYSDK